MGKPGWLTSVSRARKSGREALRVCGRELIETGVPDLLKSTLVEEWNRGGGGQ